MKIGAPLNYGPVPSLQWIEVATSFQLPGFQIIGLPAPEVSEARERVRAAIQGCGLQFPRKRVVLNLSPASIRKRGTGTDLAMALALLQECKEHKTVIGERVVAWGELGLDGTVKPAGQAFRAVYAAWREHADRLLLAPQDLIQATDALARIQEAGEFEHAPPELVPVGHLSESWAGPLPVPQKRTPESRGPHESHESMNTAHQISAESLLPLPGHLLRVIVIAAAGHHHVFLAGPRGTGKSHALDWLAFLLASPPPQLDVANALLNDLRPREREPNERIVRRVGMQVRAAALVGHVSPSGVRPGEFALAHGGLLIADELPEWSRDARESLREPLERGKLSLSRTGARVELPADFLFGATGNLCPCGGWPPELPRPEASAEDSAESIFRCTCTLRARQTYLARISGPILDRIDVVQLVTASTLPRFDGNSPDSVLESCRRIREKACMIWGKPPGRLTAVEVERLIRKHPEWRGFMHAQGSLRSRHKVVRIALTLALISGQEKPSFGHFLEAHSFRSALLEAKIASGPPNPELAKKPENR